MAQEGIRQTYGRSWAVVLAAGDGARLRPLTRRLYGEPVPKQFAVLDGERSLLQTTLDRLAPRFPAERTVVVVGRQHEVLAREQLRDCGGVDVVTQPANLGTGPGLLLPLARIRARDPAARVAVFPSDHHVPYPRRLLEGVERALSARAPSGLALIGVEADHAATDLGWIVPLRGASSAARGIWPVERFVEKPEPGLAEELLRQGALWNTFIIVGPLARFRAEARLRLPGAARLFDEYTMAVGRPAEARLLDLVYSRLTPADFSRDVLQRARRLLVVPVRGSRWSDWGSPRRVIQSLRGAMQGRLLLDRLRSRRGEGKVPRAAAGS